MKRRIYLHNRVVNYTLRKSKRAKRIRLAIYNDGNLVITIPNKFPENSIEKYLIAKSKWVLSKIDFFRKINKDKKLNFSSAGYEKNKNKALNLVKNRLIKLNQKYYQFKYRKLNIKNHKTRWGSCSKLRNLNFNYKIIFLEPKMRDYIIIHELCHLKEFNHSNKFWNLISVGIPNYREIQNNLKIKGLELY